ncbi:MAG TPA: DNA repair exonuclease [Trueperaceae bacterium]|nr:DNA repair exonuclease [Trueperaceae bacterium]
MKLLCAADLHLGRQASRLPEDLPRAGLSPAAAWRRLVDLAIAEGVVAVVLAGDVLDDENDFFEAFGDLRAGAQRLSDAGIRLVAVAGNHDVAVLPRLAQAVPGVSLLGAGGVWESLTLELGGSAVNLVGWSWPQRTVVASPLVGLDARLRSLPPGVTLGVLHCDLDQPQSRYAPVASADLQDGRVDAWLLGHVHKPTFARVPGGTWVGYLGSVFAADPGEEGERGAWLLEVAGDGLGATPVPLSPVRYDSLTVDVSDVSSPDDAIAAISAAVLAHADEMPAPAVGGPSVVGVRLSVVGRTPLAKGIRERLAKEDARTLRVTGDDVTCFVHDVRVEVRQDLDLPLLARRDDPVGLLARRLQLIDGPASPEREALLERARAEMRAVESIRHYANLEERELTDELVAGALRRAALRFLDEAAR